MVHLHSGNDNRSTTAIVESNKLAWRKLAGMLWRIGHHRPLGWESVFQYRRAPV